ncbi:MAG: YraN family protein [Clostridia bacterium]|nr:YraN family protein [Clostridia bacterium]
MDDIGRYGEDKAAEYLLQNGYKILARNYRVRGGEMDIVAFRRGVLAFIEVKTRTGDAFGTPAQAVDEEKIKRFNKARRDLTDNYLKNSRIPVQYRFFTLNRKVYTLRNDIIEVYAHRGGEIKSINHIKDAFK